MINYYKKEDSSCKYFYKYNDESDIMISVYKSKNTAGNMGVTQFMWNRLNISSLEISTEEEFSLKFKIIKEKIWEHI